MSYLDLLAAVYFQILRSLTQEGPKPLLIPHSFVCEFAFTTGILKQLHHYRLFELLRQEK